MNILIQRMTRREPRPRKQPPTFSLARRNFAIWLTVLEAKECLRLGDRAEYERLLDLAANSQMELDREE